MNNGVPLWPLGGGGASLGKRCPRGLGGGGLARSGGSAHGGGALFPFFFIFHLFHFFIFGFLFYGASAVEIYVLPRITSRRLPVWAPAGHPRAQCTPPPVWTFDACSHGACVSDRPATDIDGSAGLQYCHPGTSGWKA